MLGLLVACLAASVSATGQEIDLKGILGAGVASLENQTFKWHIEREAPPESDLVKQSLGSHVPWKDDPRLDKATNEKIRVARGRESEESAKIARTQGIKSTCDWVVHFANADQFRGLLDMRGHGPGSVVSLEYFCSNGSYYEVFPARSLVTLHSDDRDVLLKDVMGGAPVVWMRKLIPDLNSVSVRHQADTINLTGSAGQGDWVIDLRLSKPELVPLSLIITVAGKKAMSLEAHYEAEYFKGRFPRKTVITHFTVDGRRNRSETWTLLSVDPLTKDKAIFSWPPVRDYTLRDMTSNPARMIKTNDLLPLLKESTEGTK